MAHIHPDQIFQNRNEVYVVLKNYDDLDRCDAVAAYTQRKDAHDMIQRLHSSDPGIQYRVSGPIPFIDFNVLNSSHNPTSDLNPPFLTPRRDLCYPTTDPILDIPGNRNLPANPIFFETDIGKIETSKYIHSSFK
jgi:hypothetical protein